MKCESYHIREETRFLTEFEQGVRFAKTGKRITKEKVKVAYCWGTKECDECKCEGDRRKCDFYPENRKPENVEKYEKEHAPKFGEWISVKDRLPKLSQIVLITFDAGKTAILGHNVVMGWMGSEDEWFELRTPFNMCRWNAVTHWMPLPEPPKESED